MNNDKTVFRLTEEDFHSIAEEKLNRRLTASELDLIHNKFNIDDWSQQIEVFFDIFQIF